MEKPLHVKVAEALGWFHFAPSINGFWPDEWLGVQPVPIVGEPKRLVPRYDTDWAATGPLIERLRFDLREEGTAESPEWVASAITAHNESGPTPLIAVCNLILVLSEAGNLTHYALPSAASATIPTPSR